MFESQFDSYIIHGYGSLSDNSNNECVRPELIRHEMLRKHLLKVK